ncbi:hypothetical protein [Halomonas sp. WWR20]
MVVVMDVMVGALLQFNGIEPVQMGMLGFQDAKEALHRGMAQAVVLRDTP